MTFFMGLQYDVQFDQLPLTRLLGGPVGVLVALVLVELILVVLVVVVVEGGACTQ
jgi:hypothetical protein